MKQTPELLKERLAYIAKNPGCSINALYVNTSPACLAKGRKKSMGTNSWTVPRTMRVAGLIEVKNVLPRAESWASKPGTKLYSVTLTLKGWIKLWQLTGTR